MKKRIGLVVVIALIVLFLIVGYKYVHHRMVYAVTDAVFTESDSLTNLSFQLVGGKIIKMPYEEGDVVKKGALLAQIDPTMLQNSKKRAVFSLNALKDKQDSLKKSLARVKSAIQINKKIAGLSVSSTNFQIASAISMLKSKEAILKKVKRDFIRAKTLYIHHAFSKMKYQDARTVLTSTKNEILSLKEKIEGLKLAMPISKQKLKAADNEQKRVKEIGAQIAALNNQIKATGEQIKSIVYRISQTKLNSPFDGIIAKKYQNVGSVVAPGMFVYSITDPRSIYVYALLEEQKLEGIKVGNPVNITIDAYPNRKYQGVVESILPTTAAKFSLVPRDIAAGEFTKVSQRVGIRIKITKGNSSDIKVGLSGEVEIKRSK